MSGTDGSLWAPLERYLDATAVSPPPDLVGRIGARLLFEPPSTAPRRFLAALRALDARGILRGLAQNVSAAFRPGTRSMLLRAQAMAIVLVTLSTIGFGSVAGLAATQHAVDEVQAWMAREATTSPTASAAPAAPSVRGAVVQRTVEGPAGPAAADEPGTVGAPARACGLPEHSRADRLAGSEAEGCPDGPVTSQPPSDEGRPEDPAADRDMAEPPVGKGVDSERAERPAADRAAMRTDARHSDRREEPSRPPRTETSRRDRN
jgi:hypothetical protein